MPVLEVNIDLENLANVAQTGVRRAAIFMGLGLNAAARDDFNDYSLGRLPLVPGQVGLPMSFIPDDLPTDQVQAFKTEFATWIVGCGLRDMIEHYATFLDKIQQYSLFVWQSLGRLGSIDPVKAQRTFQGRLGVPDKLKELRSVFGISMQHEVSVGRLYKARNCLTHDLGVVHDKRCVDGIFALTWLTPTARLEPKDGSPAIAFPTMLGTQLEAESNFIVEMVEREIRLTAGDRLVLSHQDLREILFFFSALVIPLTLEPFSNFLRNEGVPERQKL